MKTQLDVMNIASNWEKPPVYIPKKIDIKSVVNEILALELTPVDAGIVQGGEEGLKTIFGKSRNSRNQLLINNLHGKPMQESI